MLERAIEGTAVMLSALALIAAAPADDFPRTSIARVIEGLVVFVVLSVALAVQRDRRFRDAKNLTGPVRLEPTQRTLRDAVLAVAVVVSPLGAIALASGEGVVRFGALLLGAALARLVDAFAFRRREARAQVHAYRHGRFSLFAGAGAQLWLRSSRSPAPQSNVTSVNS